jgi:hypothetical protein
MNKQESAETVALQALAWIVARDDDLQMFLDASGADRNALASGARDPVFLGALLDFLLGDDARVMAFCDAHQLPYTALAEARAALPGGENLHWT